MIHRPKNVRSSRGSRIIWCTSGLAVAFVCSLTRQGHAEDAPNKTELSKDPPGSAADQSVSKSTKKETEEARLLFSKGLEHLKDKAYADALQAFQEAHDLSPHYTVLYNLAGVYEKLEEREKSIEFYRAYLEAGHASISPARQAEVASTISTLEEEIHSQEAPQPAIVELEIQPPHALVTVDGRALASGLVSVELESGKHLLSVKAPGYEELSLHLNLSPGDKSVVAVALTAKVLTEPSPPVLATPRKSKKLSSQQVAGLTLGAVGFAGASTALGLFIWNETRHSKWQEEQGEIAALPPADPNTANRRAASNATLQSIKTVDTVTWVTAVAGGTLIAAGTLGYFVDFSFKKHEVTVGLSSLHYSTHF